MAALLSPALQGPATAGSSHPHAEPVRFGAAPPAGLKGTLQESLSPLSGFTFSV